MFARLSFAVSFSTGLFSFTTRRILVSPVRWPRAYGMIFVAGCLTCLLPCSRRVSQAMHTS
jgi:hypothetical protein